MQAARDPRVLVYAGFDFVMAALYAVMLFGVAPARHGWVQALSVLLVGAAALMGVSLLIRRTWSWWLGVTACASLLVLAVTFLALTVVSAAFLSGVYGSFGQAGALLALIAAALMVELIALLPAFQLKFLMTRAGRRAFGRPASGRPASGRPGPATTPSGASGPSGSGEPARGHA
ncbi:MAG TPA: hypothetical protein VNM90_29690 [Haliangium sp.]|nr:hypothetical protein [Haliangium sp.]